MNPSTVLIVDDERTLARSVKAFFLESGYEAEVAGTAEQALLEIISNALDAMPDGGRLRIDARPGSGQDSLAAVVIEIADTGAGIPAHVLPSVCQPFFTTRPEGTGLGLAIAKRFVEQNGGRLEISSAQGAGTVVRIWLPVAGGNVMAASPMVSESTPRVA
jgi:signal transduction histidine kinase